MQKIATRVFICSSILFGVLGILMILTGGMEDAATPAFAVLQKLFFANICVILPSFALSLAGKYLSK